MTMLFLHVAPLAYKSSCATIVSGGSQSLDRHPSSPLPPTTSTRIWNKANFLFHNLASLMAFEQWATRPPPFGNNRTWFKFWVFHVSQETWCLGWGGEYSSFCFIFTAIYGLSSYHKHTYLFIFHHKLLQNAKCSWDQELLDSLCTKPVAVLMSRVTCGPRGCEVGHKKGQYNALPASLRSTRTFHWNGPVKEPLRCDLTTIPPTDLAQ